MRAPAAWQCLTAKCIVRCLDLCSVLSPFCTVGARGRTTARQGGARRGTSPVQPDGHPLGMWLCRPSLSHCPAKDTLVTAYCAELSEVQQLAATRLS